MSTATSSKRTRGKEAVREALIEAAADLFAEQSDPSVRAIAARAGVNHGLVHHYFEGKDGLRRAVFDHLVAEQVRSLGPVDPGDPIALARASLKVAREDHRFFRVLARAMLDGDVPGPMQSAYPIVRGLVGTLEEQGVAGARARVAEGLAATLGWMLFAPWIREATGMADEEAEHLLDDALETHVPSILDESPEEG